MNLVRLERRELDLAIGTETIRTRIGGRPIGYRFILKFVGHPEFWRRTGCGPVGRQRTRRF
jgi:hypothetical protein